VIPVKFGQPNAGQESQPDKKRQRRILNILRQTTGRIDKCVLDDVRGIEAALQAMIEPQRHHSPQTVAVLGQEPAPRLFVTGRSLSNQFGRERRIDGIGTRHTYLIPNRSDFGTQERRFPSPSRPQSNSEVL